MPKRINIKKLVKENPGVDAKKVAETRKILKILREQGIKGAKYNLATPYSRRVRVFKGTEAPTEKGVEHRRRV